MTNGTFPIKNEKHRNQWYNMPVKIWLPWKRQSWWTTDNKMFQDKSKCFKINFRKTHQVWSQKLVLAKRKKSPFRKNKFPQKVGATR